MPDGVNSKDARNARVRERHRECTAVSSLGIKCSMPTEEAHHWYREGHPMREREEYMQGVCKPCHVKAHQKWQWEKIPYDEPFNLRERKWFSN